MMLEDSDIGMDVRIYSLRLRLWKEQSQDFSLHFKPTYSTASLSILLYHFKLVRILCLQLHHLKIYLVFLISQIVH